MAVKNDELMLQLERMSRQVQEVIKQNLEFKIKIEEKDKELQEKIDKKNLPITLEEAVFQSVQINIKETFKNYMEKTYNNPLHKIMDEVIEKNNDSFKELIENSIIKSIEDVDKMSEELDKEFTKKIARSIISGGDSLIEKTVNNLKQDQKFRAELLLAVGSLVDKFNKNFV